MTPVNNTNSDRDPTRADFNSVVEQLTAQAEIERLKADIVEWRNTVLTLMHEAQQLRLRNEKLEAVVKIYESLLPLLLRVDTSQTCPPDNNAIAAWAFDLRDALNTLKGDGEVI